MPPELIRRLGLAGDVLLHGRQAARPPEQAIPPITLEEVEEARLFFPRQKFFIFGHARSGTTLLVRLIRLHPDVHCNYQAHFFTRPPLLKALVASPEVRGWLERRSNRWNRGRDLSPVVLRAVSDFILERDAQRAGKSIVGDKSPNSLLDGEAVHLLKGVYPDARLIYIVRDGRDAVLSHRIQSFVDTPRFFSSEDRRYRDEFTRNSQPFQSGARSLFSEKGIRQAAEGWVRNVTETDGLGRKLFGDRYISLRFEDLLKQSWQEMARLWSFLGAPVDAPELQASLAAEMQQNPDADWQKKKASEIAGAVQKGQHGSWREMFTDRDRRIFHEVAGETLRAWGYKVE